MELNLQVGEKLSLRADGQLDVVKVWDTIQGEGPFAGECATFIRLAGCNLRCTFCDTDYTSSRRIYCPKSLVGMADDNELVVITGGEPFRQNLAPLVSALILEGKRVQIETNGTLYQQLPVSPYCLHVVCSPKTSRINRDLLPHITHWKYVVEDGFIDPVDGLPTRVLGVPCRVARPMPLGDPTELARFGRARNPFRHVYVQPFDEGNKENNKRHAKAAALSCLNHKYNLCLQMHKIVGLD